MLSRHILFEAALIACAAAREPTCVNLKDIKGVVEGESWSVINSTAVSSTPNYCSVTARTGNRITTWMKLPDLEHWNKRYVQYGCGGACGFNALEPMFDPFNSSTKALEAGYVVSANDMGVPFNNAGGAFDAFRGNFQRCIDWGHLATHLAAVTSKELINKYYNTTPVYSYHLGSSTGGRQSLVEAQRYPDDFDGLYAHAPALNETGVATYSMTSNARAALIDDVSFTPAITGTEARILSAAVLAECDAADGLVDGIVGFPRSCKPDLDKLICTGIETDGCLSATAVHAAKSIYSGPVSNITGAKLVLEGLLPGSETAWTGSFISTANTSSPAYDFATSYLSNATFWPDPEEKVTPFTIDLSSPTLLRDTSKFESLVHGGNADMAKFKQLGGKLIMTQGLADAVVAPGFARNLYERAGKLMGTEARHEFFRFFEIPGGYHDTGAGVGADVFPELDILVAWVENGEAPELIEAHKIASNGTVLFTRPIYPYPFLAKYKGVGDPSLASSYEPANGSAPYWNV